MKIVNTALKSMCVEYFVDWLSFRCTRKSLVLLFASRELTAPISSLSQTGLPFLAASHCAHSYWMNWRLDGQSEKALLYPMVFVLSLYLQYNQSYGAMCLLSKAFFQSLLENCSSHTLLYSSFNYLHNSIHDLYG